MDSVVLLIKARDTKNKNDPEKDRIWCYKQGDVIQVFAGDVECVIPPAPLFWIVKINGLSEEAAAKYARPEAELITGLDGNPEVKVLRRRKYGFKINKLGNKARKKLEEDRYLEVEWADIRNKFENKKTSEPE